MYWKSKSIIVITIKSETKVEDFVVQKDLVEAYQNATVKIMQEIEKSWYKDPGSGACCTCSLSAKKSAESSRTREIVEPGLVLRELLREARQFEAREFRILASQQVIDLFLDEESQGLAMLSDFIGKPVSLQVESAYNQEQFDIILM